MPQRNGKNRISQFYDLDCLGNYNFVALIFTRNTPRQILKICIIGSVNYVEQNDSKVLSEFQETILDYSKDQ